MEKKLRTDQEVQGSIPEPVVGFLSIGELFRDMYGLEGFPF